MSMNLHIERHWRGTSDVQRWIANADIPPRCHPTLHFRVILLALVLFSTSVLPSRADVSAPIHDWTLRIGNGAYGVTSWAPGHWDMYWGCRIEPGASVGVQYAAVLVPTLLMGLIACALAVLLLRIAVPQRRSNPSASVDGGILLLFQTGRPRPAATEQVR